MLCTAAPLLAKPVKHHPATGIKDRYIILFTSETPAEAVVGLSESLAAAHQLHLLTIFKHLGGFLCEAPIDRVSRLATDPRVDLVEQDHVMRGPLSATVNTNADFTPYVTGEDLWYLDRLDQVSWSATTPRDHKYHMCQEATNATAYLIDQAVYKGHHAFTNGTIETYDDIPVRTVDCTSDTTTVPDPNDPTKTITKPICVVRDAAEACKTANRPVFIARSHGTAVASLISGKRTGAARSTIVSVNIFPCIGDAEKPPQTRASYIVAGIDWIKSDISARRNAGSFNPSVINHSGYIYPWDTESGAVMNAVRDVAGMGIPYFTSADNYSGDSCTFTPNMYAYTRTNTHWTRVVFVAAGSSMTDDTGAENPLNGRTDIAWQKPRYDNPSTLEPNDGWGNSPAIRAVEDSGTNLGNCVSAFTPATRIIAASHGCLVSGCTPTDGHYREYQSGSSWSSPLAAAVALRWMVTKTTIPNHYETYQQLVKDKAIDGFAGVKPTSVTNDPYRICYHPTNPNYWEFKKDTSEACGTYREQKPDGTFTDPIQLQAFDMPAATNSSDARMITWETTCTP